MKYNNVARKKPLIRDFLSLVKKILILFLIVFHSYSTLHAKVVEGVVGQGEAVIEGITAEEARLIALQRARANAIENAAGIKILGSTLVKNGNLVGEFLKTFSHGFIIDEKVNWLNLPPLKTNTKGPPIFRYGVEVEAKIKIPERKIDRGFILETHINKSFFRSGEEAVITAKVSRKAHIAVFNFMANDQVSMIFPSKFIDSRNVVEPGESIRIPPQDSNFLLKMSTLSGHKIDSEAFMIVAVQNMEGKSFHFTDYFSEGELYSITNFFELYSKFADMAVEKILPYEVRKK